MSSRSWLFTSEVPAGPARRLAIQRRADEIAAETFAETEKRKLAFEELKSTLYSPRDRINAWEKLHGLKLPFDSQHPILQSIASSTELTLGQVLDEQEERNKNAGGRGPSPAVDR
jgi:hypothetical protein